MRYTAFLTGAILLVALNAAAQISPANSAPAGNSSLVALSEPFTNPFTLPGAALPTPGITGTAIALNLNPEPPQGVQSVYETYSWQAYIGYEYLRFYQVPAITLNTNGFTYSMVYYIKDWFGVDGEFDATHLNEFGTGGWFLMGAGGPRFRWSAPRGLEVWAHVLGGYSHLTPQTAFGTVHAPAYEAGGGVDIRARWRLSYRIEVDMVGTHYYNTYQYSPKVTAGIVIKF